MYYGFTISHFDFLPFDNILEMFNKDDDSKPYNENFDLMGFGSSLLITNLTDIIVLIFYFVLYCSVLFTLEFIIK